MEFSQLMKNVNFIIKDSKYSPHFNTVPTVEMAADIINIPHEDYPTRVPATVEVLKTLLDRYDDDDRITKFTLREIHSMIFPDIAAKQNGRWRTIQVHPEGAAQNTYILPVHIEEMITTITPLDVKAFKKNAEEFGELETYRRIRDWYHAFQIIHPFEDGNGRVGGVVAAYLYHRVCGRRFLAAQQ